METTRVLIIDDDEEDVMIIRHHLSKIQDNSYQIDWCRDYEAAASIILKNEHDVYLMDYYLGKGEGIEIIKEVRKENFSKPIILLTGAKNTSIDRQALEYGASDFLRKNEIQSDILERSLRYAKERYLQHRYIQAQERKYRSLFELSIEPFILLNDELKITECNSAFVDVFGGSVGTKNKVRGLSLASFFKLNTDFKLLFNRLQSEGFVKGFKTILHYQKKEVVGLISISYLPMSSNQNGSSFYVAINDLTTIMEQQEELKKVDKLMLSGRMARMIGHEVRNPLTNIRLATEELAEMNNGDEEVSGLQKMIIRNTTRISDLIDDLVKSARPAELEKSSVDLKDILIDAIDLCKDRIELLKINLIKKFPETSVVGEWDNEKLKIAITNIITNAIEAMEEVKDPQIEVVLEREGDHAMITICDNGRGMDKETQHNLFDPFYTHRRGGLGLGMTSTLNIINMHDGNIKVESEEGKGTIFRIFL